MSSISRSGSNEPPPLPPRAAHAKLASKPNAAAGKGVQSNLEAMQRSRQLAEAVRNKLNESVQASQPSSTASSSSSRISRPSPRLTSTLKPTPTTNTPHLKTTKQITVAAKPSVDSPLDSLTERKPFKKMNDIEVLEFPIDEFYALTEKEQRQYAKRLSVVTLYPHVIAKIKELPPKIWACITQKQINKMISPVFLHLRSLKGYKKEIFHNNNSILFSSQNLMYLSEILGNKEVSSYVVWGDIQLPKLPTPILKQILKENSSILRSYFSNDVVLEASKKHLWQDNTTLKFLEKIEFLKKTSHSSLELFSNIEMLTAIGQTIPFTNTDSPFANKTIQDILQHFINTNSLHELSKLPVGLQRLISFYAYYQYRDSLKDMLPHLSGEALEFGFLSKLTSSETAKITTEALCRVSVHPSKIDYKTNYYKDPIHEQPLILVPHFFPNRISEIPPHYFKVLKWFPLPNAQFLQKISTEQIANLNKKVLADLIVNLPKTKISPEIIDAFIAKIPVEKLKEIMSDVRIAEAIVYLPPESYFLVRTIFLENCSKSTTPEFNSYDRFRKIISKFDNPKKYKNMIVKFLTFELLRLWHTVNSKRLIQNLENQSIYLKEFTPKDIRKMIESEKLYLQDFKKEHKMHMTEDARNELRRLKNLYK